jgi:hypothetical protein
MLEISLKQIPTEIATAPLTLSMTLKRIVEHRDGFGILLFGKCGLGILWTCLEINKGIIWWISSVLVRKPLTDIHVAVAILDKGDVVESKCVPHKCLWYLLSSRGVGCFVLCSLRSAHRQYRRLCRRQPAQCRDFLTSPRGTISTHGDRHDKEAFVPVGHRSGAERL